MERKAEGIETPIETVHLPAGLVLRPPVSAEDLKADTELDPEGAEEFVALLRALRKDNSSRAAL